MFVSWPAAGARAFVVVAAVYAAALSVVWPVRAFGVQRFQVETAWVWCAVAAIIAWVFRPRSAAYEPVTADTTRTRDSRISVAVGVAAIAAAVLTYWPALDLGLFSDDTLLLTRAAEGRVGWAADHMFRPVVLTLWAAADSVGAGAPALHLINVAVHGVNGLLVFRLARGLAVPVSFSLFSAAIFVLAPLAIEPVVWISGLFDVLMTTCCVGAVLIARGYGASTAAVRRVALWAIAAAALLTKEVAVVTPALILCDSWTRGWLRTSKPLLVDCGVMFVLGAAIAAARLALPEADMVRASPSAALVQQWIFRTIGAVGHPFHEELRAEWPLLVAMHAAAVSLLFVSWAVRVRRDTRVRTVVGLGSWMLASVVPMIAFLYVAPDLQQARYVYLASAAWSVLLGFLAADLTRAAPRLAVCAIAASILILLTSAVAVRWHLAVWIEAAALRDRVGAAAVRAASDGRCAALSVENLPDNHRGAYIFRNGAVEWFRWRHALALTSGADPRCRFRWDGQQMQPAGP